MRNIRVPFFTLLELMLVIATIMILSSLLLPALGKVKMRAKAAICAGNLRQIGTANYSYSGDFNGWAPKAYDGSIFWTQRLYDDKYLGDKDILICPSFSPPNFSRTWYNTYGVNPDVDRNSNSLTVYNQNLVSLAVKYNPSKTWFFTDTVSLGWWGEWRQSAYCTWASGAGYYLHTRHLQKANISFLDSSVRAVSIKELEDINPLIITIKDSNLLTQNRPGSGW